MLLQIVENLAEDPADRGTARHLRAGRECRRRRYRRRRRGCLQDREPQPPVIYRALPGRGDRGRRHPARCVHDGRAADRAAQFAALWQPGPSEDPPSRRRGRRRDRRLRQLRRRADGRRRVPVPPELQRQHPGQRDVRRHCEGRPHLLFGRLGRRELGHLCRRQDRARRHPRRDDGIGRVRRQRRREAADRAGRRPIHREAPDRGVPRIDGRRRDRRDPGHGRGGAHLVGGRDGRQRRPRHRARSRPRAGARNRHEPLRDHAERKPGADADGAAPRQRGRGPARLREMGTRFRGDRARDRDRPADPQDARRARRRHPGRAAGRRGTAI